MAGIFISYRHDDVEDLATALHNRLEGRFGDDRVFFDTEDIAFGANFREHIEATLDAAGVVLAVVGPNWLNITDEDGRLRLEKSDDWVRTELLAAAERQIPVIPVFMGGTTGLKADDLPQELRFLAEQHGKVIKSDRMNLDIDHLADNLEPLIGASHRRPAKQASTGAGEATITFLFTDIEDSSVKWEEHTESMKEALARHDEILRSVADAHDGDVFAESGDGMSIAFASPMAAVDAAAEAQRRLRDESWDAVGDLEVRMAIHTGAPQRRADNYFGQTLNRTARLLELANGGQILLSNATEELVNDELPKGASLEDHGIHHLRSLHRPEHVFQLRHPHLRRVDRPLRTGALPAADLPIARDTFIGREQELATVLDLLRKSRLVTLTGVGGTGKTRLALEVARTSVSDYPDGVHVARLEPLDEDELVVKAVADALGIEERPSEEMIDVIVNGLKEHTALLTIDNCEHVIEAAAAVVAVIHESCPGVTILATSREPLGIGGEVNYRVPGLAVPIDYDLPVDELGEIASVSLFVDRATRANTSFRLTADNAHDVAKLCDYVDGIPLAIELAAARASALTPREIQEEVEQHLQVLASRSRTVEPRHKTLEAAIAWSYRLLTPEQQETFVRLSVLRGGFTMHAATSIAGDQANETIFDDVLELVAKSLVIPGEGADGRARFQMLTTLRQFGTEKLQAARELDRYAERHARYYLELAEHMAEELQGPDEQHARDQLETERDNLAAAVDWAVASGQRELAGRLAIALRWFWYWGGHILEGHLKMERVLEVLGTQRDLLLGTVAMGAGILADVRGELQVANANLELALSVAEDIGDTTLAARTEAALGVVAKDHGDLSEARRHFRSSMDLNEEIGHNADYEITLRFAGEIAYLRGHHAEAEELLGRALDLATAIGRTGEVAWVTTHIGELARRRRQIAHARATLEEAASLHRENHYPRGVGWSEMFLGVVERDAGNAELAETTMRRALETFEAAGDQRARPYALVQLAALARERTALDEAADLVSAAREAAATIGDRRAVALSDLEDAAIHLAEGRPNRDLMRSALEALGSIGDSAGIRSGLQLATHHVAENREMADRLDAGAETDPDVDVGDALRLAIGALGDE